MRRGRPSVENEVKPAILAVLDSLAYPANVSHIKQRVEARLGRGVGWNTVFRYVGELCGQGLVTQQRLRPQHGRKGLVIYARRL